jgi:hypothetical protein
LAVLRTEHLPDKGRNNVVEHEHQGHERKSTAGDGEANNNNFFCQKFNEEGGNATEQCCKQCTE